MKKYFFDDIEDIIVSVLKYLEGVRDHAYRMDTYTDTAEGMLLDEVGRGAIEGIRNLDTALQRCAEDTETEIKRIQRKMREKEEEDKEKDKRSGGNLKDDEEEDVDKEESNGEE